MKKVQAFAEFVYEDGLMQRKSAYLQWGEGGRSLGSFLLLNPGSSAPIGLVGGEKYKEATLDPTMKQMAKVVERIHGTHELDGVVQIYNLFPICNPKSDPAIVQFEERMAVTQSYHIASTEELKAHPWICFGWGINHKSSRIHLARAKSLWLKAVEDAGIRSFGKRHKNGIDYYHPCPQLVSNREELVGELAELFMQ